MEARICKKGTRGKELNAEEKAKNGVWGAVEQKLPLRIFYNFINAVIIVAYRY
jgi:hypothetical protein